MMRILSRTSAWLLFLFSTCWLGHSLLRHNCQVLEKEYFAPFIDLKFDDFEKLDFSIAVLCDSVEDLPKALKEVPLRTDWLCFTNYSGNKIEAGAFSQFSNLKSLYISGDADLLPGAFSGLTQLSTLWIESRTYNLTVYEGTFHGLNSLQELKISSVLLSNFNLSILSSLPFLDHLILEDNNITYLSEVTTSLGIFHNLQKLSVINNKITELRSEDCITTQYGESVRFVDFNISYLDLSKTRLNSVQNNSLCNFPHLEVLKAEHVGVGFAQILVSGIKTIKSLSLSYIAFGALEICKYTSFFKVKEINLSFSNIIRMYTYIGSCKHLQKLNLSFSALREVTVSQIHKFYNLLEMDLSNNHIEHFKVCANDSVLAMKLVYLNVSYNYLIGLQNGQFICLKDLKVLSLENNKINHIAYFAFDGLDQLQVLNLQYNNIFMTDYLTFSNLFSLKHLNLYENLIQDVDAQAFQYLSLLQDISLTCHEMLDLAPLTSMRWALRHISIKATTLLLLEDFLGDFSSLRTFEIDAPSIVLSCAKFSQAKELHLSDLQFLRCAGAEPGSFPNFTNIEKLYYTGSPEDYYDSTLGNMLKFLPSLQFLYLQDTDKMVKFGHLNVHEMFQGLSQLKVLYLKNSGIDHWDSKDITRDFHELEFLLVENQKIEEFRVTIFDSMPNLKYIYFLRTEFPCSCEFNELLSWLESGTSVSIINFRDQKCQLNQNTTNLISFLRSRCQTKWDLIMFLMAFHFTLLFMCMSLFYESIWWYLLYLIYTVKCWLNYRQQAKDQYDYDVFVSYNKHDQLWVFQELLPNLELNGPPRFKVCIHDRDFEIGKYIIDNIMDSIYKSRWTICIITRNFLQSNWCSLEMRMATYRLLEESKDSLILIFLDEISRNELQYYHRLTKLMNQKTYLDWPEDENGRQLFWARLRKALTESGRKLR
ncbi:toll-like receptor 12 [Gastrophryne carolinensis]